MVACIAAPADLREAAAMTKTPRRRRPSDRRVGGGGGMPDACAGRPASSRSRPGLPQARLHRAGEAAPMIRQLECRPPATCSCRSSCDCTPAGHPSPTIVAGVLLVPTRIHPAPRAWNRPQYSGQTSPVW